MNMNCRQVVLTAIAALILTSPGMAGAEKNLAFCIKQGLENNASFNAARHAVKGAEYGVKSARADFLPHLSSSYSASTLKSNSSEGPTETDYLDQDINTFNLKLSQILYAGSRTLNIYEQAKFAQKAAQAQMEMEKLELIHQIETTFYRLMKAKQDIVSSHESVARLKESVKSAKAFFDKELVPYVEVLQAQVDLADASEQLGIAKNNAKRERVALFALMNLVEDSAMRFNGQFERPETDTAGFEQHLKVAFSTRPDIKYLAYQYEIVQKEAKISMGRYLPKVQLDLNYYDQDRNYDSPGLVSNGSSFDRDQRNRYWTAGLYASWEMFDGGRAWYDKEKFISEARRYEALIQDAKNTIASGIRSALYAMSEAKQRIFSSADALEAAEEYYEREEKRLKAGLSTVPSLLDAQDRLIRAQGNKNHAIMDFYLAKSDLKLMRGKK